MTLYQDTDGKLFDDAIQRQIQLHQQNGLLSPQNATMMFGLWYKERNQVLADFRARVGSNYNASNVEGAAFDYVRSRAMSMNPYQTMAGGYPPPMPNYGAPMNYQNQWTPGYDVSRLQQSMTGMPINFNSTQQSNLNMRVSTTQVRKVTATVEPQPVTEQNDINFTEPVVDEPDSMYGDTLHDTELGKVQVVTYRASNGAVVKHVRITLADPCLSPYGAIERSWRLYNQKHLYHTHIEYCRIYKLPIPYDKFQEFVKDARHFIETEPDRYLHGIDKLLNSYPRGISTAIEKFLVDSFNYEAEYGCIDPMKQCPLSVQCFNDIVELSNHDSTEKVVQQWYKNPKFKTRFTAVCQRAIRDRINSLVVYDPNKTDAEFRLIISTLTGLTETDDLKMVDVAKILRSNLAKFRAATPESKLNDFGVAGRAVMNNTVLGVPGQHIILTNLPNPAVYRQQGKLATVTLNSLIVGGVDAKNNPVPSESLFEYFIRTKSMSETSCFDLVMEYNHAMIKYKCTKTITEQIKMVPN